MVAAKVKDTTTDQDGTREVWHFQKGKYNFHSKVPTGVYESLSRTVKGEDKQIIIRFP
jgi:hypothetical protein